jgi:hypothetical protein
VVIVAALGGCMKIYPDPELPDVTIEWTELDCRDGTFDVVLALIGDDGTRSETTVPCSDLSAKFPDLDRQRYRVEGELRDGAGVVFNNATDEADLRNGINKRVYLYFGGFSNFRASWTFAGGATCESLGASYISVRFHVLGEVRFAHLTGCLGSMTFGNAPPGTYTVSLHAHEGPGTPSLASSPESAEIVIELDGFADLGTFELSP